MSLAQQSDVRARLEEHNRLLASLDEIDKIEFDLGRATSAYNPRDRQEELTNVPKMLVHVFYHILRDAMSSSYQWINEFRTDVAGKQETLNIMLKSKLVAARCTLDAMSNIRKAFRMPVEKLDEDGMMADEAGIENVIDQDFESRMPYKRYPIVDDGLQNERTFNILWMKVENIEYQLRDHIDTQETLQDICLSAMHTMISGVQRLIWHSFLPRGRYATGPERIRLLIDGLNALFGIREAFHVPLDDFATLCPIYYQSEAAAFLSQPRRMVTSAARYQTAKQRTSSLRAPSLVRAKRVHLLPQRVRGGKRFFLGATCI